MPLAKMYRMYGIPREAEKQSLVVSRTSFVKSHIIPFISVYLRVFADKHQLTTN